MFNFSKYLKDEYQFSLKEISYSKIEGESALSQYDLKINDNLSSDLNQNSVVITFTREVSFEPASMFNLKVTFDFTLHFNDNSPEDAYSINWKQTLLDNPNLYLGNIISRASHLISEITASFGQQPLITPPNPIITD